MPVNVIESDIFDLPTQAIIHCCNSFHTWGTGIALQLKQKYPKAYEADCKKTSRGDATKLGSFTYECISINPAKLITIFNLYGQHHYGREKRHLNYEAFYTGLESIKNYLLSNFIETVSIPYGIGCMNAGGDFLIVKAMIDVIFKNSDVNVQICKL